MLFGAGLLMREFELSVKNLGAGLVKKIFEKRWPDIKNKQGLSEVKETQLWTHETTHTHTQAAFCPG